MERRDFLKLASMAGLGVVAGGLPHLRTAAAAGPYTGPFWVMVHAGGGYDPTSFCDPKGSSSPDEPDPMNHYLTSQIAQAGNIRYADVTDQQSGTAFNRNFFDKYSSRLTVINGIDCATNSHDVGTRVTWSGTLVENKPAFAALVAGIYGDAKPMSFITNGGYDVTSGVVAQTRVGNLDALRRIAYPDRIDPEQEDPQTFHSEATTKRILEARDARYQAYLKKQQLPRVKAAMSRLYTSRLGQNELKMLTEYLPEDFEDASLKRQAQLAVAAYRAGLCISANLSIGGFDTHGDHDNNQFSALAELFDGVDFLMEEAERQGVAENMVVCIGSDFGRTPGYNDGDGKDHWSITSMMFMGKGIPGNRVIGQTTERHDPMSVDPKTLQVSDSGVRITPGHIQKALRKLAGIDQNEVAQGFPIKEEEDMNFFG